MAVIYLRLRRRAGNVCGSRILSCLLSILRNFFLGVTHVGCPLFSDFLYCAFMGACIDGIYPRTNGIPSPFDGTICGDV